MTGPADMNPGGPGRDDDTLSAEYVLSLLEGAELREFELRLATEADLAARVGFWQTHLAVMTDEIDPLAPSRLVKPRIDIALFGETKETTPLLQRLAFWRGISLASLALSAALAAFVVFRPAPPLTGPVFTAEIASEAEGLRLVAAYHPDWPELRINRTEGASRPGRALELWAITGGGAPVSLGVLPEDARGELLIPEGVDLGAADVILAISDEPPGGSPTGQPTGDVLGVGPVTSL